MQGLSKIEKIMWPITYFLFVVLPMMIFNIKGNIKISIIVMCFGSILGLIYFLFRPITKRDKAFVWFSIAMLILSFYFFWFKFFEFGNIFNAF
jgi:hypothetical protein